MNENILARYEAHREFKPETFEAFPLDGPVLYQKGEDRTFYHSGDFGDIVYALPTIRALGGGRLLLGPQLRLPAHVKLRQRMTKKSAQLLMPLLKLQPYVRGVEFVSTQPPVDYDLNLFREELMLQNDNLREGQRQLNLAECHLKRFQLPLQECENRWLLVDKELRIPQRPVLLHRSARWRNPDFPWDKVLAAYADQAAFVGLPEEHAAFSREWGVELPFYETADFLELARLIAGSELYIGNQSLPYAIAEGLKKNTLLEVWPGGPNCLFQRKNANYGLGKSVYIPRLKHTMTQEKLTACPVCEHPEAELFRSRADVVRCLHCGLVYLRTRMTASSMVHLYQSYADGASHMRCPERTADIATSGLRRDYFLDYVLEHTQTREWLLDLGCGWGAFMANARRRFAHVVGVEVCHKMADFGQTVLGLDIHTDQLVDRPWQVDFFDAVVAIHSLEHIPTLRRTVAEIHSMLKPGGIFAGIVPNIESFCSDRLTDDWKWLDPNYHYTHFSPDTLKRCLSAFEIVDLRTATGDYGPEDVHKQILLTSPVPLSEDQLDAERAALNARMKGEELRFIARKI